jgi:Protein of unknown function (DUF1559)
MHSYHDMHGRLPPAVVYGEDGTPLYSWRVLLLPLLEQEELYREFHLDEPWDSPHNLTLLPRMPGTYAPPRGKASKVPPHHTVCRVFHGPGAAFEGQVGLRLQDFLDGTSNTLLVVEAGEPVPWTQPEGLPYAADRPLPELPTLFRDGFRAAFADGSVRFIRRDTPEAALRALVTRNGNELLLGGEGGYRVAETSQGGSAGYGDPTRPPGQADRP